MRRRGTFSLLSNVHQEGIGHPSSMRLMPMIDLRSRHAIRPPGLAAARGVACCPLSWGFFLDCGRASARALLGFGLGSARLMGFVSHVALRHLAPGHIKVA